MSADNGIYVHKFRDGWRVTHAQAIENIYWRKGKNNYNYRILKQYFQDSPLFKTRQDAMDYACKLYDELEYTEYGICSI